MNIYGNQQITGVTQLQDITFRKHANDDRIVFCAIECAGGRIVMEATHIRALAAALDAWEADQSQKAMLADMNEADQ